MARPQCDTPLVSIGSLSTSHRAKRERANGKKKAGRKEGRRRNNERMNKLTANYTCSSLSSGAFLFWRNFAIFRRRNLEFIYFLV
jgi:hypothetical protein